MTDDPLRRRILHFLSRNEGSKGMQVDGDLSIASTVGRVRKENQDAALVVTAVYGGHPERDFSAAVLCDGMGGMKDGREAAQTALCTFMTRIIRTTRMPVAKRLVAAIEAANQDVYQQLNGRGGTTLSAVVIERSRPPTCAHAGDSRIYALSKSNLTQLTKDDTIGGALNRERHLDDIRDNRLLQFIGMGNDLEPHIFQAPANIDRFLLTSDGAHDLPTQTFQRMVLHASDPSGLTNTLIRMSEFMGGLDNATAITLASRLGAIGDASDGLDLDMVSAFGRLAIWVPQLQEEKREPLLPPESKPTKNVKYDNRADSDQEALKAENKPRARRTRRKPPSDKKDRPGADNSQQPSLKIEFPEGDER